MKVTTELTDCWCGRSHFSDSHVVYQNYNKQRYQRLGKCKACGKYIGNLITDVEGDPAHEMGYHTACYKLLSKIKGVTK